MLPGDSSALVKLIEPLIPEGDAAFAVDRWDRIVYWSPLCETVLGYGAAEVLGRRCHEVIGGSDADGNVQCYGNCPVMHHARNLPGRPVMPFLLQTRTAAGAPVRLETRIALVGGNGGDFEAVLHLLRPATAAARGNGEAETDHHLTTREQEILACIARGMSTRAIAEQLSISPVTVRNHVQNLLHKLEVHTKFAAVAYAYQHGLLEEKET